MNEVNKVLVGQRIRDIRKNKGLTLEEFGKIFNASKGNVSLWEKGSSIPNPDRLKKIAELGNMTVTQLLQDSETDVKARYIEYFKIRWDFWRSCFENNTDLEKTIELATKLNVRVISWSIFESINSFDAEYTFKDMYLFILEEQIVSAFYSDEHARNAFELAFEFTNSLFNGFLPQNLVTEELKNYNQVLHLKNIFKPNSELVEQLEAILKVKRTYLLNLIDLIENKQTSDVLLSMIDDI